LGPLLNREFTFFFPFDFRFGPFSRLFLSMDFFSPPPPVFSSRLRRFKFRFLTLCVLLKRFPREQVSPDLRLSFVFDQCEFLQGHVVAWSGLVASGAPPGQDVLKLLFFSFSWFPCEPHVSVKPLCPVWFGKPFSLPLNRSCRATDFPFHSGPGRPPPEAANPVSFPLPFSRDFFRSSHPGCTWIFFVFPFLLPAPPSPFCLVWSCAVKPVAGAFLKGH